MNTKDTQLSAALSKALERRRRNSTLRSLTTKPSGSIDFSSNDFLSLSTSSSLRTRYIHELSANPNFTLGSGGSRLLDGNSPYAERLETDIATFHGAQAGLLCNSGFDANAGIFSCLPQEGDVIIYDEYIHASVHDGMKVSRAAKRLPFAHNDVGAFTRVLQECISSDPEIRAGYCSVFIALEAIYSMDGDMCPLLALEAVVSALLPKGNGHLIVDEAHSTGVLGSKGRGLVSSLHLESKILVRLHTFGKALAANGAIILCPLLVRQYLINYARPLIYTTFLSFPSLAAIRASHEMLVEGGTEGLERALQGHIRRSHAALRRLQAGLSGQARRERVLKVADECPLSPIFSVETCDPRGLAGWCQEGGFVVRAIMPPTVPVGAERVRVCLHAGNTDGEIDGLVARIGEWCKIKAQEVGEKARDSKL